MLFMCGRRARFVGVLSIYHVSSVCFRGPRRRWPARGPPIPPASPGMVTDNTGAVLPGVTVTATSPALQVPSVTTCLGRAGRVPPVAAADWRLHRPL